MKKTRLVYTLLGVSVIAIGVCGFTASSLSAKYTDFKICIDEKSVQLENPIIVIENSAYLPVREFCENFGFEVNWLEEDKMIDIKTSKDDSYRDIEEKFAKYMIWTNIKLGLPDDILLLNYHYNEDGYCFNAKISVSHDDIENIKSQLEKEYGNETDYITKEWILDHLPNFETACKWWDLDLDIIETLYYGQRSGIVQPDGFQAKTKDIYIFILQDIGNRNLIYISY